MLSQKQCFTPARLLQELSLANCACQFYSTFLSPQVLVSAKSFIVFGGILHKNTFCHDWHSNECLDGVVKVLRRRRVE